MLYSEKFHWLLIEDFAWQGRLSTVIEENGTRQANQASPEEENPRGQYIQALEDEKNPSIESFLGGMNLYMNTELTLAKRLSKAAHYTLFDVW